MGKRTVLLWAAALAVGLGGCRKEQPAPTTRPAGRQPASGSAARPAGSAPAGMSLQPVETKALSAEQAGKAQRMVNAGLTYLLSQRNADGGWGFAPGQSHPALTAMVLKCLLQHPDYSALAPRHPVVAGGFDCLMKFRQDDGGFYNPQEGNANYCTSVAVMALAAAKDPALKPALADAMKFLRGQQIRPGSKDLAGQTVGEDSPYVGGVSYGRPQDNRPDLSNLGFWMEAMHEAGVEGDDPDMQRALAFVQRVQNRTEGAEGQTFVVRGEDDGGFIYGIRRQGEQYVAESKAGAGERGLRSYGSMTYTGFKSMLYANVARDDPRVRAAYDWIRRYWRLDSNPNMPGEQSQEGLYYYYHVFAKALRAWGQDVIADSRGVEHNWRAELIAVLSGLQKPDGSWANEKDRWMETSPALVTCYSVLALQEALGK